MGERAREGNMPVVYVNQVGGQDELVFDGHSFVVDARGQVSQRAPAFAEGLYPVIFDEALQPQPAALVPVASLEASVYDALVLGVRDYVRKNGFKGVVLGLSGGIDSALVLAVAADALGAEQVEAVMMPYHYTAQISLEDAEAEARTLGVRYSVLPIAPMVEAFQETLASEFAGLGRDTTEENLQARCRGTLLMAISNKKGYLVLTTGNKSEMAVGYATLYGDMAGGFDVLKDVPKTLVFRLCEYRNRAGEVIPQRVIDRRRRPSCRPTRRTRTRCRPIRCSTDPAPVCRAGSLGGGYRRRRLRRGNGAQGAAPGGSQRIQARQAAVGARVTQRGFGRDRRYPITSGWRIGD